PATDGAPKTPSHAGDAGGGRTRVAEVGHGRGRRRGARGTLGTRPSGLRRRLAVLGRARVLPLGGSRRRRLGRRPDRWLFRLFRSRKVRRRGGRGLDRRGDARLIPRGGRADGRRRSLGGG